MAIGLAFDTIHSSSPTLASSSSSCFSKECLGSSRIPSYTSLQRNHYSLLSSHSSFLNPSLFQQLSALGPLSSKVKNLHNSSPSSWTHGGQIGNLTSAKKCGQHVKRNSLIVSELNCSSCSNARFLGRLQQDWFVGRKRNASVVDFVFSSSSECSLDNKGVRGAGYVHGTKQRPGRRQSTKARCEAEGGSGGVSYNERTVTEDSGDSGSAGSAGGYTKKGGGEILESDTALLSNGSSGEDGEGPSEVPSGSLADVLQETREEAGEESALEILREILRVAQESLEISRNHSEGHETNSQKLAAKAIALKDEAKGAERLTNAAIGRVGELLLE